MTLPRDVVVHVALVLPDGRFYGQSVRIPPEQWATSVSHIRDVESWLEGASRAVLDQLRDDGMQ